MKTIYVIGGPNGAGKTTLAMQLLPQHLHVLKYLNADDIARGLNPLNASEFEAKAGRIFLETLQELTTKNTSFAFETTCSGTTHIRFLKKAIEAGYKICLIYVYVASIELSLKRIESRILQGGHKIEPSIVQRRYPKSLYNLIRYYLPLAHEAIVLDNSDPSPILDPIIIAHKYGKEIKVINESLWQQIEQHSEQAI